MKPGRGGVKGWSSMGKNEEGKLAGGGGKIGKGERRKRSRVKWRETESKQDERKAEK